MGFLDFLDNVENKINNIESKDEIIEDKKIIQKEINYNSNDIKIKLICELNRVGLKKNFIDEIIFNIFNENVKSKKFKVKGNFKEKANKLKKETIKETSIEYASTILDGMDDISVPVEVDSGVNEVNESDLNMDNMTDHASSLL